MNLKQKANLYLKKSLSSLKTSSFSKKAKFDEDDDYYDSDHPDDDPDNVYKDDEEYLDYLSDIADEKANGLYSEPRRDSEAVKFLNKELDKGDDWEGQALIDRLNKFIEQTRSEKLEREKGKSSKDYEFIPTDLDDFDF